MANILTPYDVYQIVNEMAKQSLGEDLKVVDTSSFVSVGERMLRISTENTLNALSTVISKTIFSTRPYTAKYDILRVGQERWGAQVRKISYLWKDFEQSEDWNTQLAPNQLADGNSVDMYKINKPEAVQYNFYGTKLLQKHITRFRTQIDQAFHNEYEFMQFLDGAMIEYHNEVEVGNEVRARLVSNNFIAAMNQMNVNVVDVIAEYNREFGTDYTRSQLLTTHLTDFMQWLSAHIKIWASKLTDFTYIYHANPEGGKKIPRHSPKARQRMIMYEPIFITAQSRVYSALFNPKYLDIGKYEGVNYWQNPTDPTRIQQIPNYLDPETGNAATGVEQNIPYVLGILYDEEALGIMPQFDYASTTPFNSAGGYWNMYTHWRFNAYNDMTENAVLFVMGDGGAGQIDVTPVEIAQGQGTTAANALYSKALSSTGGDNIPVAIQNQPIRTIADGSELAASESDVVADDTEPVAQTKSKK